MPELPEVHTIVCDLKRFVVGATITKTQLRDNYKVYPETAYFVTATHQASIIEVSRLGKNIVFKLSSNQFLVIHLAMTGNLFLTTPTSPPRKWLHVTFELVKKTKVFQLRFHDKRFFGKVKLLTEPEYVSFAKTIGPDVFMLKADVETFFKLVTSKTTPIKNLLLDQHIISGLGNAYVTDALWLAQLHPTKITKTLTREQAQRLLTSCVEVLTEGVTNRGISMSDYLDLFGKKGTQQDHFKIYHQPTCPICQTPTSFIQLNGRGTYFCATCQQL